MLRLFFTLVRLPRLLFAAGGAAGFAVALVHAPASAEEPLPTAAQPLFERGIAERRAGRPDAAVTLLSLAAARDPANAGIRLQLALALMVERRLDAAARELSHALQLAPGYVDADIALAYIDLHRGDRLTATTRAQRLLARHPDRGDVLELAAHIAARASRESLPVPAVTAGLRLTRFDGSLSDKPAETVSLFAAAAGEDLQVPLALAVWFGGDATAVAVAGDLPGPSDPGVTTAPVVSPDAPAEPAVAFAADGWAAPAHDAHAPAPLQGFAARETDPAAPAHRRRPS